MKKILVFAYLLGLFFSAPLYGQFITTWQTDADDTQLTIPAIDGSTYNYDVYWENTTNALDNGTLIGETGSATLTGLSSNQIYRVEITNTFPAIYFNNVGDKDKILTVEQWGDNVWNYMHRSFYGCSNLTIPANDAPDLSGLIGGNKSLQYMFTNATSLNESIDHWNVSIVNDFFKMFSGATSFNQPLNNWDVSSATSFSHMFEGASSFNQPLGNWNPSGLTAVKLMFKDATSFNHNINHFDVDQVTDFAGTFEGATSFNQPLHNWDVGLGQNFGNMFFGATAFDQSLGNWDISSATSLGYMIFNTNMSAVNFDQTLTGWVSLDAGESQIPSGLTLYANLSYCNAASSITLLEGTYSWDIQNESLNCDDTYFITTWKTDNTGASGDTEITMPISGSGINVHWELDGNPTTFGDLSNQTGPITIDFGTIGTYIVEITATNMDMRFDNAGDKEKLLEINQWGAIQWSYMYNAYGGCINLTIPAIDAPDLSSVTDARSMFENCSSLNSPLDHWDVSNVQQMSRMFRGASVFNQDLNNWDMRNVYSIDYMFQDAIAFDGNITSWQLDNMNQIQQMFSGATSFDQPIGGWDVSGVSSFYNLFASATSFNQDIDNWNVLNASSFDGMFYGASSFNQDLISWNVSGPGSMSGMFRNATAFEGDISGWNVSEITSMAFMFSGAINFNGNISGWQVGDVSNMGGMFTNANVFNQDISGWTVSSVRYMNNMFNSADNFDQDISGWETGLVENFSSMFSFTDNFDSDVSGWNTSSATNMSGMFQNALTFDQNLGAWNIGLVTNMTNMLSNSGMSSSNYDATLIGWEDDNSGTETIPSTIILGATGLTYCDGASAKSQLEQTYGWTISDGGQLCGMFTVVNTNDSGTGSLRWAIDNANSSTSKETIEFNIVGSGPWVISPTSALPEVDNINDVGMVINGSSQPGWAFGNVNTMVTIDGGALASSEHGIEISEVDVEIYGLIITNFTGGFRHGIIVNAGSNDFTLGAANQGNIISANGASTGHGVQITDALNVSIQGNRIGTSANGLSDNGNVGTGLLVTNCNNLVIGGDRIAGEGNLIAGNQNGVIVNSCDNAQIYGNLIGVDASGDNAFVQAGGLYINGGDAVTIGGVSTGQSNVISGASSYNLRVGDGTNVVVENNIIGLNQSGNSKIGTSNNGIWFQSDGLGNIIRGNTISGNNGPGISLDGVNSDLHIESNQIGTALDGTGTGTDLLNRDDGISVVNSNGTDNLTGQIRVIDNVISGNGTFAGNKGIDIWTSSNLVIQGNLIGVEVDGITALGNAGPGIKLGDQVSNVTIGGTILSERNIFANSQGGANGFGIEFTDNTGGDEVYASNIDILQNLIYCNQGEGIRYSSTAPLEAPVVELISATSIEGTSTAVNGSIVYVYEANDGCNNDQGANLLGSTTVTDGAWTLNGSFTMTNAFSAFVYSTDGLISPFGLGMVVTNTNDSGAGSFREVLETISDATIPPKVKFNIPGVSPWNISLASVLPSITANGVVIDGTTQPDWDIDAGQMVTLDGSGLTGSINGLNVNGIGVEIYGLKVSGFPRHGIVIHVFASDVIIGDVGKGNVINSNASTGVALGWGNGTIQGNRIGTDFSGAVAAANATGISAHNSSMIMDNLISGNSGSGIFSNAVNNHTIRTNKIGTDLSGLFAIPNDVGIVIVTGGNSTVDNNLISGNTTAGISSNTGFNGNDIINNVIGLDVTNTDAIPNGNGILFAGGTGNRIGFKDNPNIIAGNTGSAIESTSASSSDNIFVTNQIFNNGAGIVLVAGANGDIAVPSIDATSSWEASGTGPEGVTIHLYLADASGQGEIFLDSTEVSGNTWSITGLSLNEDDELVATSTDYGEGAGTSEFSSSIGLAPNAPSDLFSTETSITQIDLTWSDNSAEETNFAIFRSNGNNSSYIEIGTTASDITTYSDNTVSSGNNYFYYVVARNAGGDSSPTNEKAAATLTPPGNALTFDGVNDYVSILDDDALQFGTSDFTLEMWFYFNGTDIRQTLISKRNTVIPFDQYFIAIGDGFINSSTGKILYGGVLPDNRSGSGNEEGVDRIVSSPDELSLGWHHVALVQDYSDGLFLYLDGFNISSDFDDHLGGVANSIGHDMTLGASSGTLLNFGDKMDEVRVWNDVRTEAEIQANMFSDLEGNEIGLIAYYKFDQTDATATILPDRSTNTNDGILTNFGGAAAWVTSRALIDQSQFFITTWKTDNTGTSNDNQIIIPTNGTTNTYDIYWEEVGNETTNGIIADATGDHTITFPTAGTYRIKISGDFPRIYFNAIGDRQKILTVEQWGDISWTSMENAFFGCTNLTISTSDTPDLSVVSSFANMFRSASSFDQDISGWDVTNVTDMTSMFNGAIAFNNGGTLLNWDVKTQNVLSMSNMFNASFSFDQDISSWDVSNVTHMNLMFKNAKIFNQDISTWDVSAVTNMAGMFNDAESFNNGGAPLTWNTGTGTQAVLDMSAMFDNAISFNQDISSWNVSGVTTMWGMFSFATAFNNGGITLDWGASTQGVTTMQDMFIGASSFNQDISSWDVSSVTTMRDMFDSATAFDNGGVALDWVAGTGTQNVISMENMLESATSFNQDISSWDVSSVQNFAGLLYLATSFDQSLASWDISNSNSEMYNMLNNTSLSVANYDATLIGWLDDNGGTESIPSGIDLGSQGLYYCNAAGQRQTLIDTYGWTFDDAGQECAFITTWQTDNTGSSNDDQILIATNSTTNSYDIYWEEVGNETINGTIVNATGNYTITFPSAGTYRVNISGDFPRIVFNNMFDKSKILTIEQWGDVSWTSMNAAFSGCINLSIPATDAPDLSNVIDMSSMFKGATSFDSPIDHWEVGNVEDMNQLFYLASSFNQDLNSWDVREVTDMNSMFLGASLFNGMIGEWNLLKVSDVGYMLSGASSFNQDISNWVFPNLNNLYGLFDDATSFNQDISSWDVSSVVQMGYMFSDATSFNQNISGWDVSNASQMQGMFRNATVFDQDLGGWDISLATNMTTMLHNAGLSQVNYDATLTGWATLDGGTGETLIPSGITLGATGLIFCTSEDVRQTLIDSNNWTFSGDSKNCPLIGGVEINDYNALVSFYNATDGANWINNSNWLSGDVDTWFGVTVSGDRVTDISLESNNLSGILPVEIGDLTALIHLDLSDNQLSGSIPLALGNLVNLKELYIGINQLTGVIPSQIGNLLNLTYLELDRNQLTGSIPLELGNLVELSYLELHVNMLTGEIPAELGSLTNIVEFQLDRNQLTGEIPDELGNLINLQQLHLYDNQLVGTIPTELGSLIELTDLELDQNQLTGPIPTELGNLVNLIDLDLHSNQLSGAVPSELNNLTQLEYLELYDNDLNDLPDLSILSMLIQFEVEDNNFEFDDVEPNLGITGISYSPQSDIAGPGDQVFDEEDDLDITITVGGANNEYQWIKDGIDLVGQTTDNLVINGLTPEDNGIYALRITNTIATDLTLMSDDFDVTVFSGIAEISVFEGVDNSGTEILNGQVTAIDFGTAYQGSDISLDLVIENVGNTDLTISSIVSSDASFVITNAPTSVLSGETKVFEITLSGVSGGVFNSTVSIDNNDSDESPFQFPITGEITPLFNGILEQDYNALVALYNAADGGNWSDNTNWLSANAVDSWFGVTVLNYEVVEIDLSKNGLSGDIGGLMNNLQAIQTLDLSGNLLENLPDLSGLTQLTTLSIEDNLLHFDDIEENIGIGSITFSPQGMIVGPADLSLNVNDELNESIIVGGSANLYQWTKDGVSLFGQTSDQILVSDLILSDAGSYQLEISSSIVTGLTLSSEPFELTVIDNATSPEFDLLRDGDNTGIAIANGQVQVLDFGSSNQGFDLTEVFIIENKGNADLMISNISSSDISFSIIDAPTVVPAGLSENFAITLSSAMVGSYSADITVISNDSDEGTFTFSVSGEILSLNIPVTAIATSTSLCLGAEVSLTGSGASTYIWDNGVVDGVSFVPDATATYTVTGTDDFGNVGTDEITITVNPIPSVMANVTSAVICLGDEVTLSGSGADTYVWDNGVVDGELFTPTETNNYLVVGTDLNGCSSEATIQVTVNKAAKPKISIVSDNGRNIVFTSTVAESYQWYEGDEVLEDEINQILEVERTYFFGGDYSVEISEGECTNVSEVFNNPILSSETEINDQISIWPNPVSDFLSVQLRVNGEFESELVILDFSGRTIKKSKHNEWEYEVSLSEMKKGVYVIQLKQGDEVYSETLVVE